MGFLRLALSFILAPPLFVAAAVCVGAAAVAQMGDTNPRWDVLAHFAPVWLAGGLGCALVAFLLLGGLSRLVIVALGLAGAVFSGLLMAPEFTRATGPQAGQEAPGQIKLVQFNVWHGSPNPRISVDWLLAEDPDIAVLEETTPRFREMVRATGRWRITCPTCEVMILSKRFPKAGGHAFRGPRPGPIARATFRDKAGEFTVIGVHEAWPTDADQPLQEARLARTIDAYPRKRTIVAGDFNSAPWSFQRRHWDAAFGLVRRERALFTWPATHRRLSWLSVAILPIDHIYAGEGWATVSVRRGPKLDSDHYPVVAVLAPVTQP